MMAAEMHRSYFSSQRHTKLNTEAAQLFTAARGELSRYLHPLLHLHLSSLLQVNSNMEKNTP